MHDNVDMHKSTATKLYTRLLVTEDKFLLI